MPSVRKKLASVCPRCTGFLPGNTLRHPTPALSHGAYSLVEISAAAEEVATQIRELVPVFSPIDEAAVRALAIVLVRIGRAEAALEQLERETEGNPLAMYSGELKLNGKTVRVQGLKDDLRGWLTTCERYLSALGATPASRARLGLDIVRAQRGLTVLDLHAEDEEVA